MGSVLEAPAPPEMDDLPIIGEVPIDGDVLSKSVVKDFFRDIRILRGDNKDDPEKKLKNSEIFIRIPNEKTGVPDRVSLEDSNFQRNPDGPGFKVTYPEEIKTERGKRTTKEKTIFLSVGAAIVVASSLIAYRHKK